MEMLSKPERELLEWLGKQEKPITLEQLEHAPSYSVRRQHQLVKGGMIYLPESGFFDSEPRTYAISDKGRAALEAAGSQPMDVFVGEYPSDARCFHSLAVLPAGAPPEGYDTVVLAGIPDGLMNAAFRLEGVPVSPLFACMPELESLRSIYAAARRVSRRPSHFLARNALVRGIAEEADESEAACAAGLCILSDMALLTIENTKAAGFRVTLPPLVKRDPAENPWFRRMQAWREQALKGR